MEQVKFNVTAEWDGERIDKCISANLSNLSRSYIQKLIKSNQVIVENESVKPNYRCHIDDEISLTIPEATMPDIEPENMNLDILYEDDDVIVINKPKGMVVHPAPGHYSHTMVNGLLHYCKGSLSGINGVLRPGIVHRIDKDTTGSIMVCKNDNSHKCIAAQLKEHSIKRTYRAIVCGVIEEEEGTVDAPIGRHPNERMKMAVYHKNGKPAVTHYKVLKRFLKYTYIECRLETGRTHQIRVHMTSIGHPLLGDEVYGKRPSPYKLEGQTLHAYELGFIQPTSKNLVEVIAPVPEYFVHLLNILD